MKFISNPDRSTWQALTQRPTADFSSIEPIVDEVFAAVRSNGDAAVREYSQKFDAYTPDQFFVDTLAFENAKSELSSELVDAIDVAYENIYLFHKAQKTAPVRLDTKEGISCWQEKKPIEKVGVYIPGGTAPLFSTVLMLAIPAQLAGCSQIVLCTPPNKAGVFVYGRV